MATDDDDLEELDLSEFEVEATPVVANLCSRCGAHLYDLVPCAPPPDEFLLAQEACVESPGRWVYCARTWWLGKRLKLD